MKFFAPLFLCLLATLAQGAEEPPPLPTTEGLLAWAHKELGSTLRIYRIDVPQGRAMILWGEPGAEQQTDVITAFTHPKWSKWSRVRREVVNPSAETKEPFSSVSYDAELGRIRYLSSGENPTLLKSLLFKDQNIESMQRSIEDESDPAASKTLVPLQEKAVAMQIGDVMGNVEGQGGRRYFKVTIDLWVMKAYADQVNKPELLPLMKEAVGQVVTTFSMEDLKPQTLGNDVEAALEKLVNTHLGTDGLDYFADVVLSNLLIQ